MNGSVLVLNRSYLPVHVTNVRRAFVLMYQGVAKAVDREYALFDFESWAALSAANNSEAVGTVDRLIRIPRVILLTAYDRIPRRNVRFSRQNIYLRDRSTCQYCGRRSPRHELNLDHVVPRTNGGRTTWENVVCSCVECNRKKGGRTPEQAGMRLRKEPRRPQWTPLYGFPFRSLNYDEWKPFLGIVDASYWNVELEE